jgi:cytochrome c553
MSGFAAGLSEQDIKDVAAWFSSQSGLVTPSAE